uniref:Uncharacterized protein n=1 Tax=Myoviridae sp. ctCop38 TaxID=2826632 RepID=A0A8S5MZ06_9CAUD|nr:MAG TPA: hypothetical protein [Myoviridae sp. ctCop38]
MRIQSKYAPLRNEKGQAKCRFYLHFSVVILYRFFFTASSHFCKKIKPSSWDSMVFNRGGSIRF